MTYQFLIIILGLFSQFLYGFISLQTNPLEIPLSKDFKDRMSQISENIISGRWDEYEVLLPIAKESIHDPSLIGAIVYEDEIQYLKLTSTLFQNLSEKLKKKILEELIRYYKKNPLFATVNVDENHFVDEPVLNFLAFDLRLTQKSLPAEKLLSPYAERWAHQMSKYDGPNCFHSSVASIFPAWKKHRYMGPREFKCHIDESFEEIQTPAKWGDLIRFRNQKGQDIHGFTFLGVDKDNPEEWITFTKNGYAQSYYLFMRYLDVLDVYSRHTDSVTFYRAKKKAVDPYEHKESSCNKYIGENSGVDMLIDPVIEYAKREYKSFRPIGLEDNQ